MDHLAPEHVNRLGVAFREQLICSALQTAIFSIRAWAGHSIEHPDALDYKLQGRATWLKPRSRDVYAEAVGLFERALALDAGSIEAQRLDAGSIEAQSWLATELASRAVNESTDTPAADIASAEELAKQAVMAAPRTSMRTSPKDRCFECSADRKRPFPNTKR